MFGLSELRSGGDAQVTATGAAYVRGSAIQRFSANQIRRPGVFDTVIFEDVLSGLCVLPCQFD